MTPEQRQRYERQIRFEPLGENGQQRLLEARVAVVGCGALGSFQAASLARAGVGYLRLIDRDFVEVNNLHRQWLYDEGDAAEGIPKAVAAAQHLATVNSTIEVEPMVADLTAACALDLLSGVDLLLDGTDNFETRYLMNDFAVSAGIPWVYGGAVASHGIVMPVIPGRTACLKCVYPEPPGGVQPTCETAGVLNTVTALVASLQSGIAMRILAGDADEIEPRITTVDAWSGAIRQITQPEPDGDCPACARREFRHLDGQRRVPISLCGRNAVQIHERERPLDLAELKSRLEPLGSVRANEFALRFFIEPYEMTIFPDGRAIIKGTQDTGVARTLYAKYVGA